MHWRPWGDTGAEVASLEPTVQITDHQIKMADGELRRPVNWGIKICFLKISHAVC